MVASLRWTIGLSISLVLGHFAIRPFLELLRNHIKRAARSRGDLDEKLITPLSIDNRLIGFLERVFFTLLIAFQVQAAAAAMMTWVFMKMLINWNLLVQERTVFVRSMAFSALLGNLVSMLFALVGGLICAGKIR